MQELHVHGRQLQGGGPGFLAGASVSGFVISMGVLVVMTIAFCYSCYLCKYSPDPVSAEEDEETTAAAAKPAPPKSAAAKSSAPMRYNTLRASPPGASSL